MLLCFLLTFFELWAVAFADFFLVWSIKQCFDECVGVEFCDVLGFFAEADEFYRYVELVFDGDDDSAASGAVKFC